MGFVPYCFRAACTLTVVSISCASAAEAPAQCNQEPDSECGYDRSILLQLPGLKVDPLVSPDNDYPNVEIVMAKDEWPGHARDADLLKDMKLKTNAEGDLAAFMSALTCDTAIILICFFGFCVIYRRYPLVFSDNVTKGLAPRTLPDTMFGWIEASWNLPSEQVEGSAGLDAALLIEFTHLALRVLVMIGVPMVLILCPLHFAVGGGAMHDKLGKLGMGNVVSGVGGRWVYWVHAVFVWYVVVVTQRAVCQAQEKFLKRRNAWMLRMTKPRANTVLVEGIPDDCCTDDALKERFCQLFPGDKIASAYIVRDTSTLTSLVDNYNSADRSLAEAKFQWEKAGGSEDVRPQLSTSFIFGTKEDKIDFYENQKKVAAEAVVMERHALSDPKGFGREPTDVFSTSGFVTFRTERDAAIALCLKVRSDEYVFMMSTPPDPADVTYADLYADPNRAYAKSLVGYGCVIGLFFSFTPFVLAITELINLTALRKHLSIVDKLVVAFPMSESILEGVLASAALTLFMSFLPTFLSLIFSHFFHLKAGMWLQHRIQIWYFWFQVVFVLLITAVGSSLGETLLAIVNHPALIFDLLADRLPTSTHFYLNFMVMQWVTHAMNLTRYVNLMKFKALSAILEEDQAKELSEPEDQDYYGMGARSARFTLNLVIALVYCSLCPLITVVAGINFVISRAVYTYLLVFAETRKPDLGGHFWVTQLVHVQHGLLIYVMLMVGVLVSRGATHGPAVVTAPALLYLFRTCQRFHTQYEWEYMPFEDFIQGQGESGLWKSSHKSSRESYDQPELTEPALLLDARKAA